jgi:hypothetical protein
VNAIADAIKDDHPHVLVETFAYILTLEAPKVTKPRDNVVIRICIASCNFAAPYSDPVNTLLYANMKAWGKISKNIAVWDCERHNHSRNFCPPRVDLKLSLNRAVSCRASQM